MQLSSNKQQNIIGGKMLLQLHHGDGSYRNVSITNLSFIKSSQITFFIYLM
jgi:hypothetical protein